MNAEKMIANIIKYLSVIILVLFVIMNIVWRFQNPDMTQTRLLITYWKEYLQMAVVAIIYFLVEYNKKN